MRDPVRSPDSASNPGLNTWLTASLLCGPRSGRLVLAERAGELFIGEGAGGSDAGFEEALAAK
jgi:hypothetical protein